MAKLYFRYGAMNCGKTTTIIQVAYNYEERGKKVLLIKPSVDTKGENYVLNRSNLKRKVDILLPPKVSIKPYIQEKVDAILIDEAQFLSPNQVDELFEITKLQDIPVLCYGLRCDFKKATINVRLVNGLPTFEGEQIVIDGNNNTTYESMCGYCYLKFKEGAK